MVAGVTKEKFDAYERVRRTGLTNMLDWQAVQKIAYTRFHIFLDKRDVLDIVGDYEKYHDLYAHAPQIYVELAHK